MLPSPHELRHKRIRQEAGTILIIFCAQLGITIWETEVGRHGRAWMVQANDEKVFFLSPSPPLTSSVLSVPWFRGKVWVLVFSLFFRSFQFWLTRSYLLRYDSKRSFLLFFLLYTAVYRGNTAAMCVMSLVTVEAVKGSVCVKKGIFLVPLPGLVQTIARTDTPLDAAAAGFNCSPKKTPLQPTVPLQIIVKKMTPPPRYTSNILRKVLWARKIYTRSLFWPLLFSRNFVAGQTDLVQYAQYTR